MAGGGEEKVCCVEEFSYPKSLKRFVRRTRQGRERKRYGRSATVGFCFTVTAEFKESDECACKCCQCFQSVSVTGHVGATRLSQTGFEEDYIVWKDSTGTYRHSVGRRTVADPATSAADEKEVSGVASDPEHEFEQKRPHFIDGRDNYSADAAGGQGSQASGCFYKMRDCPTIIVKPGESFCVTYRFIGEIWDVCVWQIAEGPKYFTVTLSGGLSFGQVRVIYDAYRSDADGNRGEQLAAGDITGSPYGNIGPAGYIPPDEQRTGSDYPAE